MNIKWSVGSKIGAGFALGLTVLVGIGAVAHRSIGKLAETAEWVDHTHKVLAKVAGLLQSLVDAETGQRGYIITGEESSIEPYFAALNVVERDAGELKDLTRDNPTQQRRLEALEPMVAQRVAALSNGT